MKTLTMILGLLLVGGLAYAELKPEEEAYLKLIISERKALETRNAVIQQKAVDISQATSTAAMTYDPQISSAAQAYEAEKAKIVEASKP